MTERITSAPDINMNSEKDAQDREAMFQLIESGEAIAFLGAGLSKPLYPTWPEFLQKLAQKAVELTRKPISLGSGLSESDVLDYAEAIKAHFEGYGSQRAENVNEKAFLS